MSAITRRSSLILPLLAILSLPVFPVAAQQATTCPDAKAITAGFSGPLADIRYLADDALEGREIGSPGARCAGRPV